MKNHPLPHVFLALLASAGLAAADLTFTGAINADWSTGGNWSLGAAPTASDRVTIPTGLSVTISNNGPVCEDLTVVGTLRLVTDGSLEITNGATVEIQGSFRVEGINTSLRQSQAADGDNPALTVTIASTGNFILGTNDDAGQLKLERGIELINNGTLTIKSRGTLTLNDNSFNRLETSHLIDWTMTSLPAILFVGGGDAVLGGTLTAARATTYFPSEGDEATLLNGATTITGDFSSGTISGFTRVSTATNKVAFTSDADTALANTITILTTNPTTPRYGDVLTLTASASNPTGSVTWSGLPTDVIEVSGTTARIIGIGTGATIQVNMAAQNGYQAASHNIALNEILPKQITVTINGGTRQVGGTNPTPSLIINGLVTGDLESILGTPTYTGAGTTANTTTAAGSYAIGATFPSASNKYEVNVVPGTLVITAADSGGSSSVGASGGGGGGCGAGGGLGLLAAGALFLRRRRG